MDWMEALSQVCQEDKAEYMKDTQMMGILYSEDWTVEAVKNLLDYPIAKAAIVLDVTDASGSRSKVEFRSVPGIMEFLKRSPELRLYFNKLAREALNARKA